TRAQAEDRQAELETSLAAIDDERRAILMDAREQAQAELAALRTEIKRLRRRLKAGGLPLQELQQVAQQEHALEEVAAQPISADPPGEHEPERALRLGDSVRVERLQAEGVVTALSDSEAEVQIGRLRLRAGLDELRPGSADTPENGPRTQSTQSVRVRAASPGMELHLRGQRIEVGLQNLERYLDTAVLAELPWVRIVHGKGTGQMRRAVRDALRAHPEVKSFRPGEQGEGGDGVTVAMLEG
ncbi:MAG: Smr/MutS family protein, partial [Anaerolineales bacterium]|nr:Smr/MutS family protein [Anaerolineales bacterium]